ncbi:wd repeat-containing protein pop1 [Anaeramoeba flamelloides]|uniref:Wd repeat-containing protein pop1 n=1 Tax=Anaeramoeba flamelloides TaxID=1746091 RepID=A0AAV8A2W8_9EUKA|nr:wd repeat-containing protein pop1 [Anaeramoeba flamelloides]
MTEDIPVVNPLGTFQGHLSGINGISLYESHLFTCSDDKTVKKWTLEGENVQHFQGHNARITGMKLVNEILYTGSHDKTAMSWSLRTGKVLNEFIGHEDRLSCLLVKDERMFTGSADHTVRIWDTQSGNCQQIFSEHTDQISGLVYKNNTLLTSSVDKTIRVWSTETGQCKKVLSGHKSWILAQYFDDVNDLLYTASKDGEIKCWDLKSYECVSSFKAHKFAIIKLELHNKLVYSASWDGTIGCIDMTQNKLVRSLEGHDGKVSTFGIFQNNLYSGGRDRTVRVWNLKNGKCEYVYVGHRGVVQNLSFTETEIFSVGSDGNLIKWPAIKSIGKKKSKTSNQNRSEKKKRARRIRFKTNNPDEKFVYYLFDQYDDLKQKIERVIQCGEQFIQTNLSNLDQGNELSKSILKFVESEQDSICQQFPEDINDIYQIPIIPFLYKYGNIREQIEKKRKTFLKFMKSKFLPEFQQFQATILKEFKKKINDYDFATKEYFTLKNNPLKTKKKNRKKDQQLDDLLEKAKRAFLESKVQIVQQLETIETTEMFKLINIICQFFQTQTEYYSDCYDLINQIEPFTGLIISKIALKRSLSEALMLNVTWLKYAGEESLLQKSKTQNLINEQKLINFFDLEQVQQLKINLNSSASLAVSLLPNRSTEKDQLPFEKDQLIQVLEKGDHYSLGVIGNKSGKFLTNSVLFVSEDTAQNLGYITKGSDEKTMSKTFSGYFNSHESDSEYDSLRMSIDSQFRGSLRESYSLLDSEFNEKSLLTKNSSHKINSELKNDQKSENDKDNDDDEEKVNDKNKSKSGKKSSSNTSNESSNSSNSSSSSSSSSSSDNEEN